MSSQDSYVEEKEPEELTLPDINDSSQLLPYIQYRVSTASVRDDSWLKQFPAKVKLKDRPIDFNRKYKNVFNYGAKLHNFGPRDFLNKDYRSEYHIYLSNVEKYLNL